MPNPTAMRLQKIKLGVTRGVLLFERVFDGAWPFIGILAGFVALALLEVPQSLGGIAHGTILALVGLGMLWAIRRFVLLFRAPTPTEVVRRLETTSGLDHRPLSTLDDKLANDADPVARAMWAAHRERVLARQAKLRVGEPRPILSRVDPYAVHGVIGLALVVGLVVAGDDARQRLFEALTPRMDRAVAQTSTLDLWVNPPAYTGLPPMLLTHERVRGAGVEAGKDAGKDVGTGAPPVPRAVAVAIDSRVLATVNGGRKAPELRIFETADGAPRIVPFEPVGGSSHQVEARITAGVAIEVTQDGDRLGRWDISILADTPPSIELAEDPKASERDALSLRYAAVDDYGVIRSIAEIRRVDPNAAEGEGAVTDEAPIIVPLPLPRVAGERVEGKTFQDLTPHPWAGQPVEITLVAIDDIDQEGRSEPTRSMLPERVFFHPVARAIIEQRKRLVVEENSGGQVAQVLMALAARPGTYDHDTVVFLSLKSASARLALAARIVPMEEGVLPPVLEQLWETALRIEDGNLSLAARKLRQLEQQLQEALANDAPQEEIERLMDQLQDAIDEYLNAMEEQMQEMMRRQAEQQGRSPQQQQQMPQGAQEMSRQDLKDMVERARDMARSGARESAREMLSRLQEMMENMQAGRMQRQMQPEQQAMQEMMRQLGEMARNQQQLMDQTFRQRQDMNDAGDQQNGRRNGQQGENRPGGQRQGSPTDPSRQGMMRPDGGPLDPDGRMRPGGQSNQPGQLGVDDLAELQESLRRQLGEFMRKLAEGLGQIPEGFGSAERSMKSAVGALQQGEPGEATGPQGDALDHLQQGTDQLMEELRQQLADGQGQGDPNARNPNQNGQDDRDPLDRRRAGYGEVDRSDIGIPTEIDTQRAREIFEELRRRAGDRSRPTIELDYIERLLDRF